MHGGIPQGKDYYHVNVCLFDSQTKSPITDAEVEVRIADPVHGDLVKTLDLMVLGNTPSYGNYVILPGNGPYTVDESIRRPGAGRGLRIPFSFQK